MLRHTIRLGFILGLGCAFALSCAIEGDPNGEPVDLGTFTPTEPPAVGQTPPQSEAVTRTFRILHTNDEHSHLLGFNNSDYPWVPDAAGNVDPAQVAVILDDVAKGADQKSVGGLVRRQYMVNKIREESADPVLLLSAGDVMMGTLFHAATPDAAPDYLAMALLGYDFVTLGNHAFDWGPDSIYAAIGVVTSSMLGGAVPIISSNIHFGDVDATNPRHGGAAAMEAMYGEGDSGAPIMPWATKTLSNGLKIGFVGLTGYEAALSAPGKAPLVFSVPTDGVECPATACETGETCTLGRCVDPLDAPGHIAAMAADLQPYVNDLRDIENVDVVVALAHVGWNDVPALSEITSLAMLTDGIDIFVDGHSHDVVPPTVVPSQVGSGSSIIVQAGNYGRYLGELVVTVDPDGAVGYDAAASSMHAIDYNLDVEILADTDMGAGYIAPELERALKLTGAVVGPVLAGLNAAMAPALGVGSILDPVVASDHDIIGELPLRDSDLIHLVADAERFNYRTQACDDGTEVVAAQGNGVIRDSLRFGADGTATAADVFRVVPLGASPFETQPPGHEEESVQAPGYPVVAFHLLATELLAGADIGVTRGLQADSFFLSFAGMRVEYDTTRPPFDATDLENSARITKMELGDDTSGYNWVLYDVARGPFANRWRASDNSTPIDPNATLITVVSNLYLTGFLDAFGLAPRDGMGATIGLESTVLCRTKETALACSGANPRAPIAPCISVATPPWSNLDVNGELKEWQALMGYLGTPRASGGLGGQLETGEYNASEAFSSRVKDVTP